MSSLHPSFSYSYLLFSSEAAASPTPTEGESPAAAITREAAKQKLEEETLYPRQLDLQLTESKEA